MPGSMSMMRKQVGLSGGICARSRASISCTATPTSDVFMWRWNSSSTTISAPSRGSNHPPMIARVRMGVIHGYVRPDQALGAGVASEELIVQRFVPFADDLLVRVTDAPVGTVFAL